MRTLGTTVEPVDAPPNVVHVIAHPDPEPVCISPDMPGFQVELMEVIDEPAYCRVGVPLRPTVNPIWFNPVPIFLDQRV